MWRHAKRSALRGYAGLRARRAGGFVGGGRNGIMNIGIWLERTALVMPDRAAIFEDGLRGL
jgi:hypothetical protein